MKIGIFTGTFDPFTIGHQNIAERALPMFDKLVIAVAVSKLKHASEEISKRVEDIKAVFPKECSELVDAEDASKGYRLEVVSNDEFERLKDQLSSTRPILLLGVKRGTPRKNLRTSQYTSSEHS